MSNASPSEQILAPLSTLAQWTLAFLAFILVAFGQPAWSAWFCLAAAIGGYALFFRVLFCHSSRKKRFWLATTWFFFVQLVQLSWSISHPYMYIYGVYFFVSLFLGVQFGLIGCLVTMQGVRHFINVLAIAGLWTLLEWSRLFVFSGFSWNPIGLALADNAYTMQMASIWGVFGMSFWVMMTNLLGARAWVRSGKGMSALLWLLFIAFPYGYGIVHLSIHSHHIAVQQANSDKHFTAMLMQPAFPTEESISFVSHNTMVHHVVQEWRQILEILKKHKRESVDLIAFPEFTVPFGAYSFIYPIDVVFQSFREILGPQSLQSLPKPTYPLSYSHVTDLQTTNVLVNNAYWTQAIANYFQAGVVVGLEDAEDIQPGIREYYSAALYFTPEPQFMRDQKNDGLLAGSEMAQGGIFPERYEKRILVPMGEYIPFEFCKKFAEQYGVFGSFSCGKETKVMSCSDVLFSPSICYEETFGDLIRDSRRKGANLLVNLTSDVWYPNSKLPRQHFDHARLRSVENGVPLLRSCNTGVTACVDSLGRIVAMLGGDKPEEVEWVPDALLVDVPLYHYQTIYSKFGDLPVVIGAFAAVLLGLFSSVFIRLKN